MAKVYVASSWRNPAQPRIVTMLRDFGHAVYDFRDPPHGQGGFFSSHTLDPHWRQWSTEQYRDALNMEIAEAGYRSDVDAMEWADACVLVWPCGRSAYLEAGWFVGKGKPVYLLIHDGEQPELMVKMCTAICVSWSELLAALAGNRTNQTRSVCVV
jgi:hypothetical protein